MAAATVHHRPVATRGGECGLALWDSVLRMTSRPSAVRDGGAGIGKRPCAAGHGAEHAGGQSHGLRLARWGTKHIQPKTSVKLRKPGYWSEAVRTFRCLSLLSRRTMQTAHNIVTAQFFGSQEASCWTAAVQNDAKCVVNIRTRTSMRDWPMSCRKQRGSGASITWDMTRPSTLWNRYGVG